MKIKFTRGIIIMIQRITKTLRLNRWLLASLCAFTAFPSIAEQGHVHDLEGETCFMCDASKRDKGRLWCREHARYEDRCWLCHPELEDKDRLYCEEHFLYEDECSLCRPHAETEEEEDHSGHGHSAQAQEIQVREAPGHEGHGHGGDEHGDGLFCNEHGVPEIECAICQPVLAAELEPGAQMKVRLASSQSADKAGIQTSLSVSLESRPTIKALCEVQYNLNTMAKVTPLAGGVIRKVSHDVGTKVQAGDVLVELHSAEVANVKSAYLSAIVNRDIKEISLDRERRLKEENIAAAKDYMEAEAAYRTAQLAASNLRHNLLNLGLTESDLENIVTNQNTSAQLMVRAPFSGTLVERNSVVGEAVETGDSLFTIANLSTYWLNLSIPSGSIGSVELDQVVEASFRDLPGISVRGRITWVDTAVDSRSRMVRARALVTGADHRIKAGLFGEAQIVVGESREAAMVPQDAVQRYEGGTYIFVRDEPDLFSMRRITTGSFVGDQVEILEGLNTNEAVVVRGSFIVLSEALKWKMGAGCAGH